MTIFADTRSTAPSSLPFDVSGQRPACVRRVSACACGGEIVVERGEDIATIVRQHQSSLLHLEWRQRLSQQEGQ